MSVLGIKQRNNFVDSPKNSIEKERNILQSRMAIINPGTLVAFPYYSRSAIPFNYVVENRFRETIYVPVLPGIATHYHIRIQKKISWATHIISTTGTQVLLSFLEPPDGQSAYLLRLLPTIRNYE
ncbi:MAG: hypothetical protein ABI863_07760 [Ginsengibacter sp.]